MKPNLTIISTFKATGADGAEHYTGTIDIAVLRKLKQHEVNAILMPARNMPEPLGTIMTKNSDEADLIMFAVSTPMEKSGRPKKLNN